jgi:hypothetical protein
MAEVALGAVVVVAVAKEFKHPMTMRKIPKGRICFV